MRARVRVRVSRSHEDLLPQLEDVLGTLAPTDRARGYHLVGELGRLSAHELQRVQAGAHVVLREGRQLRERVRLRPQALALAHLAQAGGELRMTLTLILTLTLTLTLTLISPKCLL